MVGGGEKVGRPRVRIGKQVIRVGRQKVRVWRQERELRGFRKSWKTGKVGREAGMEG
jgi:hypothetical protein